MRSRDRGQLEAEILRVLRGSPEPLGAEQIRARLTGADLAATTVLTVLHRLSVKGEVVREELSPRRVRFRAAKTEAQSASASMRATLTGSDDRRAVLLAFAGDLDDDDLALLRAALRPKRGESA